MTREYALDEIARLPAEGDNVAIAVRRLEAGTQVRGKVRLTIAGTVMEGHRFAVSPIPAGAPLLSWGLPFGLALVEIAPGAYVCNQGMLDALSERGLDFDLPSRPNFADSLVPYTLDEGTFRPGTQVPAAIEPRTFLGYDRGERGVGTRSVIVVLGTSSRTGGFARLLAERTRSLIERCPLIDGVVAVDHTEGGGRRPPHNLELVLRALSGFLVHPNVAAVLAVDYGGEAVTNRMLRAYAQTHGYPLDQVPHRFLSLTGSSADHLRDSTRVIADWLAGPGLVRRTAQPVSRLKVALQCGGSDAFSGVSGNPLAAWVAREIIRHGGSANLAETDELMGAEAYVLRNARDLDTARRFLGQVARFKERLSWHGESAEGNPSGGNKYRGLYNIALKSIGAATKRHPEVRLDEVIDYAQPMTGPGYYFMDSPGNDLESITGQVASGCNLIFFVTGNGSVTNFPFVPTLKITTTTARHELLARDMDINAGAYLDGTPMDELGRRAFELALTVAGGARSHGELAGHAQVQLWRAWPQANGARLPEIRRRPVPDGRPLPVVGEPAPSWAYRGWLNAGRPAGERVGLVLPTSLCSAQVARLAAARLEAWKGHGVDGVDRFLALVHTEGCGVAGPGTDELFDRAVVGYLSHPSVCCALVLEHGCEKAHNDYVRHRLADREPIPVPLGWASVQLDGGIATVLDRIDAWFAEALAGTPRPIPGTFGLESLCLGLTAVGRTGQDTAAALARVVRWVAGAGGTVILPANAGLWTEPAFLAGVGLSGIPDPTLDHGQAPDQPGLHAMEAPSEDWAETMTGLGAAGPHLLLAQVGEHPLAGHPLVPVVQVTGDDVVGERYGDDLDLLLTGDPEDQAASILRVLGEVASRQRRPRASETGNWSFQVTRGLLGVSM